MGKSQAPTTASYDADCPMPDLVARRVRHFGHDAWEFECPHAIQVQVVGSGLTIACAVRDEACRVENGVSVFVNSPKIELLKGFLTATAKHLRRR